eukprot:scaffold18245_cov263-Skeletonema_marinoi.AAC.1
MRPMYWYRDPGPVSSAFGCGFVWWHSLLKSGTCHDVGPQIWIDDTSEFVQAFENSDDILLVVMSDRARTSKSGTRPITIKSTSIVSRSRS